MPFAKCFPNNDVIDGLATIAQGAATPAHYDPTAVSVHVTNPSGDLFARIDGRFVADVWAKDNGSLPLSSSDTNVAPSGADAVLNYGATPSRRHVLFGVTWSYENTPASGLVQVESPSGTVIFAEPVTAAGPGFFPFDDRLKGVRGSDLRVVLKNGNSAKRVGILGRRVE